MNSKEIKLHGQSTGGRRHIQGIWGSLIIADATTENTSEGGKPEGGRKLNL